MPGSFQYAYSQRTLSRGNLEVEGRLRTFRCKRSCGSITSSWLEDDAGISDASPWLSWCLARPACPLKPPGTHHDCKQDQPSHFYFWPRPIKLLSIAIRICALPSPMISTHCLQRPGCLPTH